MKPMTTLAALRRNAFQVVVVTALAAAIPGAVGLAIAITSGEWTALVVTAHIALTVAMLVAFSMVMFFWDDGMQILPEVHAFKRMLVEPLSLVLLKRIPRHRLQASHGLVPVIARPMPARGESK